MTWPDETGSAAGTTASGTPFTAVTIAPLSGDDTAQMVVPLSVVPGSSVTVLIAAHGHDGSYLTFQNDGNSRRVRDMAVDAGWVFVAPHMHGNRWGNPTAVADVLRVRDYLREVFSVERLNLYGQSMGGMAMMQVVAQGVIPEAGRLAVLAPACNLARINATQPSLRGTLRAAYGAPSDDAGFAAAVSPYDPVHDHTAEQYAHTRVAAWASDDDELIPKQDHIDAFTVAGLTSRMASFRVTTVSGGHLSSDHYRPGELREFYTAEYAPTLRRSRSRYILVGRRRHEIKALPPRFAA